MIEITGNIWTYHDLGEWICITTNGSVKLNSEAVMGRGTALQAKIKYPDLPKRLGQCLIYFNDNIPFVFEKYKIISFPVKNNWQELADFSLIENSCKKLKELVDSNPLDIKKIYLTRPGCGNGKLNWENVKPILLKYFDDRFIVINLEDNHN
jgi:hypothetical protein